MTKKMFSLQFKVIKFEGLAKKASHAFGVELDNVVSEAGELYDEISSSVESLPAALQTRFFTAAAVIDACME